MVLYNLQMLPGELPSNEVENLVPITINFKRNFNIYQFFVLYIYQ